MQTGNRRGNNALKDDDFYFVNDLGTYGEDYYHIDSQNSHRYNSGETVLAKKFDSTIRNGRVMPALANDDILNNKSDHLEHTNEIYDRTETEISNTNLSSQDFAEIISKSLKPTDPKFPDNTQNEMAGSSKWEKYNSQHSEEEINLDTAGFKSKVKDFTVIEKTKKAQQFDRINTGRCDTIQHCHEISKNCSSVSKSISHSMSVKKGNASADKTHDTCSFITSKLLSPNPYKVPSPFSSMDSFEQMLADESLDFNDPDLDKVLMTQTGIERMTDKQLNALPADSQDYKNNFRVNTNTLEDNIGQTKSLCPDVSDCSGCSDKTDLEIDIDAKAIVTDVGDKKIIEQNEKDAFSMKRLSSDNSFSLDDSFLDSHQLHSSNKSAEIKSVPSTALRVPWKQIVLSRNDNEI
ncbi:MAG: hypothetical protein AB2693_17400, partial [Candidatus Thiodiazotropha sp.]